MTAIALIFLDKGYSTWLYWKSVSPCCGSKLVGNQAKQVEAIRGRRGKLVDGGQCIG